jgi:ferric-dicitrate binding protein FerR (iron transport regulator)
MSRDDESTVPPELREQTDAEEEASDWSAMWGLLGHAAPPDDALPDADDTWAAVQQHIDEEDASSSSDSRRSERRPRRPSARRSRRRWTWGSIVAAVLALVFAAWWWTQPVDVAAPAGTTVARTLPDGSTVELHGDTRLTYPRTLATVSMLEAERRVVQLEGEAYFEVEPGDRPFIVQTPSVRVEVLGTAFSVRSRVEEDADAHVALTEGRLRVTGASARDTTLTLTPGQVATMSRAGTLRAVPDTSIDRLLAWRRGGFAATARPLPALTRDLERRFGRSIRLDASIAEATRSDPLTLYYTRTVDLETILHDVCMARGLTYRPTANGYVLATPDDSTAPRSP